MHHYIGQILNARTFILNVLLLWCIDSIGQSHIVEKPTLNLTKNEKLYYLNLAKWYCISPQFNLDSAFYYLDVWESNILRKQPQDYLSLAEVNVARAKMYYDFQFFQKTKENALRALDYYKKTARDKKNDLIESDIYFYLSVVSFFNQEEKKALLYYTKCDSILKTKKDENLRVKYALNKASFHYIYSKGEKELSYKIYKENLPYLKRNGDFSKVCRIYMILAMNPKNKDDHRSDYFSYRDSARVYAIKSRNPYIQHFYTLELNYALLQKGKYKEASEGITKVLNEYKRYGLDKTNNYQNALQDLAEVTWKQKQYDKAITYYKECLSISDSLQIVNLQLSLLEIIADIYHDKGDYQSSLEYLNQYKILNALNDQAKSDRSFEEHELELNLSNQRYELERNKLYARLLAIGLLFLFIVIFYVVYSYRKQRRLNTLLQNNIRQKEVLLKEIHHRVKNNLSVISGLLELQSNAIKDNGFELTFKESQNRVKSIALIHQRLYQYESLSSIELKEYLEDLYKQIYSVFKNKNQIVDFINKVPETFLDIDTAVPIGLILNELFTNSFKYAFNPNTRGEISIELHNTKEGSYQLIYKDNGKGLGQNFDFKKVGSFGLKLVNRLCIQLFGRVGYEYCDNYSIFNIDFKDNIGKMKTEQ